MTSDPRRSARVEFPNDLEIVLTRDYDAPIGLVFDVLTRPEHVRKTFAPFGEEVTVCSIDLRVGGDYHIVMVTDDGIECSFRGTYLELDPPHRTVQTWRFDGWPGVQAVESVELRETDAVTTLVHRLVFADQADRDHMSKTDGLTASFNNLADYLRSLLAAEGASA